MKKMIKSFIFFIVLLPAGVFAQVTISGRVLNQADTKPVANASVFLSNASAGDNTSNTGIFTLTNARPGKYDLVVSIIGFETYHQSVLVQGNNITLPDIVIFPTTIALREVKIKSKADPNRWSNYEWFKNEFLGTSEIAKDCHILNPDILFLESNEGFTKLTASTNDFLIIENQALGYRIKYLLTNFVNDTKQNTLHFEGPVLFEAMKGTPAQERRWQRKRQDVYEGSQMHFLRSLLNNRLDEEGFRVRQYAIYQNPQRPPDSVIMAKIKVFRDLKAKNKTYGDSISIWEKKLKLPQIFKTLMNFPLDQSDILQPTDQQGIYALGCNNDALHITYNADRHFSAIGRLTHIDDYYNKDITIFNFNKPYVFFDKNGWVLDAESYSTAGAWGFNRVAELLPVDYVPVKNKTVSADTTTTLKNIYTRLNNFLTDHITEKAYLHFDKPYYAAGDTIYFKAYLTLGEKHSLSNLSGVLNVDLINTGNKIDQSIKLQVNNGVAWGDFALPDSLLKGSYHIRAYTRWMRNDSDGGFFDQAIAIGTINSIKIPESGGTQSAKTAKPEVQFFPEGGELVEGLSAKIAFKAIGPNGLGVAVKGVITDNNGTSALQFASTHLGMGSFNLKPAFGKTYKAKITYADGTQDVADLPVAKDKRVMLSVNNDTVGKISVKVSVNKPFYAENKSAAYNLVIYAGGAVTTIPCVLDSDVVTLDVLKRHIPTGIATITLFSPQAEPVCERLVFVQNYDQLNLQTDTNKGTYPKRGKVSFRLTAKDRAGDPSAGHFSVSVTDETKVPVVENNENTILTNLLLTSDLKGYVEQPDYYFINPTNKTNSDLDLVMLTHGYRRLEWKKLLKNDYTAITFQPEKGLQIAGVAKSAFGKPLKNGIVSLLLPRQGPVLRDTTDDQGKFRFNDLLFTDSAKFILQAVNSYGKNTTKLVYLKEKMTLPPRPNVNVSPTNEPPATFMENDQRQHAEAVKYGIAKGILLKEVKIKESKKRIIDDDYPSSVLGGPGHADQVMHRKQIMEIGGPLSTSLNGRLRGVVFYKGIPYLSQSARPSPMALFVDGVQISDGVVDELNPNNIETVEVLKDANATIYGIAGHGAVLAITTRRGGDEDPNDIQAVGILPITVMGFYKAREFYAPKYEHPADGLNRQDLRSTIYWQPELITDKDGNASFDYYNADGTGNYRVVIEGIDENGNLGRQVFRYKVE